MAILTVLVATLAVFGDFVSADSASEMEAIAQMTALYPECAVSIRLELLRR
jgi:hypothetical protein